MPLLQQTLQSRIRVLAFGLGTLGLLLATNASANIGWVEMIHPDKLIKQLTQQRCPDGFRLSQSGPTVYCLKQKLKLPKAPIQADCGDLAKGRLGFSWPKDPKFEAYACPNGSKSRQSADRYFCDFNNLFIPEGVQTLRPYCNYLNRGYFGYSYRL